MAGVDYFSEYQLLLHEVECRGSRMPKMGAGKDNDPDPFSVSSLNSLRLGNVTLRGFSKEGVEIGRRAGSVSGMPSVRRNICFKEGYSAEGTGQKRSMHKHDRSCVVTISMST